MTSTDHRPSTAIGSRRRNQRFVGGVAAGSTLGLALAHLLVNLAQLPADAGLGPLAGPVLTPAVAALLLSGTAVLAIAGRTPPGGLIRWSIITGAVLMWLLLLATAFWSVASSAPLLLRPDGPGPWALVAAPAYTALARTLRSAARRSNAARPPRVTGHRNPVSVARSDPPAPRPAP
jgi:hypothetical protein